MDPIFYFEKFVKKFSRYIPSNVIYPTSSYDARERGRPLPPPGCPLGSSHLDTITGGANVPSISAQWEASDFRSLSDGGGALCLKK